MHYSDAFPELAGVYLEDSWVLDIDEDDSKVTFELDLVLTEGHPLYAAPKPNEQYCYARADLVVSSSEFELSRSDRPPATDATGETDLGNIDSFLLDDGTCRLEGDWGQLAARAPSVVLNIH